MTTPDAEPTTRAERETWLAMTYRYTPTIETRRMRRLIAQVEALEAKAERLIPFMQHHLHCQLKKRDGWPECDCGLRKALEQRHE